MAHHGATIVNGAVIVSPQGAADRGLEVPDFAKGLEDFVLAYDRDDDLIAWGPTTELDEITNIIRSYTF